MPTALDGRSRAPVGAPFSRAVSGLPPRAGLGLKPQHFSVIVESWPDVGFFEVHAENYLVAGGPYHHFLTAIRERYPLSIHGVGLSIGARGPLDRTHLLAIRALLERYQPALFSEHLAWSSHGGRYLNDLLPLPYDVHTLACVSRHIEEAQEVLRRPILLENPATYVEFRQSTYSEGDFLTEIVRRTGCGLLVDINNAYVAAANHGRDARKFLSALPLRAVGEIHLAGFHAQTDANGDLLLIDSHGSAVHEAVLDLYAWYLQRTGPLPTLIEWDNDVPSFDQLWAEARRVESVLTPGAQAVGAHAR